MRLAADKLAAKRLADVVGVPTIPAGEPCDVGYPLILKAAAGGGGRGMRVVRGPNDLEAGLEAARREAQAAFGTTRSLLSAWWKASATSRFSCSPTRTAPSTIWAPATARSSGATRSFSRRRRRPASNRSFWNRLHLGGGLGVRPGT